LEAGEDPEHKVGENQPATEKGSRRGFRKEVGENPRYKEDRR
jgi:hypothetical protein